MPTNWSSTWGRSIPPRTGVRVILRLDGEKFSELECVIGYLHRGVEKIGEHRTYTMFNPYVDRMDYVPRSRMGWATARRWRSCSTWKRRSAPSMFASS